MTYRRQERLKEAEELGIPALEIQNMVLGMEHPDSRNFDRHEMILRTNGDVSIWDEEAIAM